jgi:hypothetical protein
VGLSEAFEQVKRNRRECDKITMSPKHLECFNDTASVAACQRGVSFGLKYLRVVTVHASLEPGWHYYNNHKWITRRYATEHVSRKKW